MWNRRINFDLAKQQLLRSHELRSAQTLSRPELVRNSCNDIGLAFSSLNQWEKLVQWMLTSESIPIEGNDDANLKPQANTHCNVGRSLWLVGRREETFVRLNKTLEQLLASQNWGVLSQ